MRRAKTSEEDQRPLLIDEDTAMSKDSTDPFYTVKDNVNSQVEKIKVRHEKFLDLVKNTDTSSNGEFKELRAALVKDVRKVIKDLNGLKGAVDMVDKNRLKFPHIKDGELSSRKRIVEEMNSVINEVKSGMESTSVRRKMEDDENKSRSKGYDESSAALNSNNRSNEIERDNTRFIADQKQITQAAISNQDIQLDSLGNAVERLQILGSGINEELHVQDKMLDSLGNDLDDASSKMNVVMASLSKLLKTKDGCQIWTIVILAVILIILVALIIWV